MRIIVLSIISWLALLCLAVVVIFLVTALFKTSKKAIKKIGVSKNKFIIGLFILIILVIVLSLTVVKYFVLKSTTDKISESRPLEQQVQKEEPIQQTQLEPTLPKEPVLTEKPAEQVESFTADQPEKEVLRSEQKELKEEKQRHRLHPLKPSKAIFTVQVGAFSKLSYAESLKSRLRKKGYNVYMISAESTEGRRYRICIGKFSERKKAETLSEKIRNSEGLPTFVTSLQP